MEIKTNYSNQSLVNQYFLRQIAYENGRFDLFAIFPMGNIKEKNVNEIHISFPLNCTIVQCKFIVNKKTSLHFSITSMFTL